MNAAEIKQQKAHPGVDARLIVKPASTTILFYSKRAVDWALKKGIPAREGTMQSESAVTTKNASNTGAILQPMIAKRFVIIGKNAAGERCQVKRKGTKFAQTIVLKPTN